MRVDVFGYCYLCKVFFRGSVFFLFFASLSSQVQCYEWEGKIKVVEIRAAKPWDAVEFFNVCKQLSWRHIC